MKNDINLEYYKIFYYVAKNSSITLGAEELSISQPAVSQGIRNLEKALDCKLFLRTPKGVRLTNEGVMLFSYVERGYETILAGEHKLGEFKNLDAGEICIGASDMTLQFYLLPYLERFHEEYPQIKVTVTNAPTPETLDKLENGGLDFGAVSTPFDESRDLVITRVKPIQDVFVAGKKFRNLQGKKLSYDALQDLPVMCLEGKTSTRKYVTEFLEEKNVVLQPEFELANSGMLVQFAKRSLGIASVVEDFAKEDIETGDLFVLSFTEPIPPREICIVSHKKMPLSNAARKLLEMIQERP